MDQEDTGTGAYRSAPAQAETLPIKSPKLPNVFVSKGAKILARTVVGILSLIIGAAALWLIFPGITRLGNASYQFLFGQSVYDAVMTSSEWRHDGGVPQTLGWLFGVLTLSIPVISYFAGRMTYLLGGKVLSWAGGSQK
jgi:hypothetical protein